MKGGSAFGISVFLITLIGFLMNTPTYSQIPWDRLKTGTTDPIYTTYAADRERSEYLVDEGYHLVFYLHNEPIKFSTDTAGELSIAWKLGGQVVVYLKDMYQPPVITRSYHDLVELEFYPFTTIRVRESFLVYNSRMALLEVEITNLSPREEVLTIYPFFARPKEVVTEAKLLEDKRGAIFFHSEPPEQWFQTPLPDYQTPFRNIYLFTIRPPGRMEASLKRMEVIGLLPLWAGVASQQQAKQLIKHLSNPHKFWRRFGIPALAADDPYYGPFVTGCCRWNGPV